MTWEADFMRKSLLKSVLTPLRSQAVQIPERFSPPFIYRRKKTSGCKGFTAICCRKPVQVLKRGNQANRKCSSVVSAMSLQAYQNAYLIKLCLSEVSSDLGKEGRPICEANDLRREANDLRYARSRYYISI